MGSSKYMSYGIFALAAAIMLVAGVVQGLWSERWGTFPELVIFSEQLEAIPSEFGEWKGEDGAKSDEKTLKVAGAEGEFVKVYRNANNEEVRVSIICARMQDIFYHTPDRCYPAAGFEMQGEPEQVAFDVGNHSADFFTTSFLKSEPTGSRAERGFWSWSADGTWVAPKNPKLYFVGSQRALYKLYVFAAVPPGKQRADRDFCSDFIKAFVPVLEASLRPAAVKAGRVTADTPAPAPVETPVTVPAAAPLETPAAAPAAG